MMKLESEILPRLSLEQMVGEDPRLA